MHALMRRVLRRGGRVAIVVWDEPRKNPFFEVMFTAAASLLGLSPPEAGRAGPFRLASPARLAALLRGADRAKLRPITRGRFLETISQCAQECAHAIS